MQLNDLIKENTVKGIAKKTNISENLISKLSKKDFDSLKKPQVMGAISIIEREYDVDLSSLRQECKEHFKDVDYLKDGMTVIRPVGKEKRVLSKFISLVLLALLAYSAWYFFVGYYKQRINPMDPHSETSFIDKFILGHDQDSDAKGQTADQNLSDKGVPDTVSAGQTSSNDTETNMSEEHPTEKSSSSDLSESDPEVEVQGRSAAPSEESIVEESSISDEEPAGVEHEVMVLAPQKEMWFELIDLETKKRTEFKRQDSYEINLREHGWLLATKGARFSIIDNDLFEDFDSKEDVFLKLDKRGIHRLSGDEYRAAAK